jgi:hypothetical protein
VGNRKQKFPAREEVAGLKEFWAGDTRRHGIGCVPSPFIDFGVDISTPLRWLS